MQGSGDPFEMFNSFFGGGGMGGGGMGGGGMGGGQRFTVNMGGGGMGGGGMEDIFGCKAFRSSSLAFLISVFSQPTNCNCSALRLKAGSASQCCCILSCV